MIRRDPNAPAVSDDEAAARARCHFPIRQPVPLIASRCVGTSRSAGELADKFTRALGAGEPAAALAPAAEPVL
jgi:hypothetical protein